MELNIFARANRATNWAAIQRLERIKNTKPRLNPLIQFMLFDNRRILTLGLLAEFWHGIVEGFSEFPKVFTFSYGLQRLGTFSLGGISANDQSISTSRP
jgi:hypothetical protein